MIQIKKVNNAKEYILTASGIDVIYTNGRQERLVANRTLKAQFKESGLTLSRQGDIIEVSHDKNDNNNKNDKKHHEKTVKNSRTKRPTRKPTPRKSIKKRSVKKEKT